MFQLQSKAGGRSPERPGRGKEEQKRGQTFIARGEISVRVE